MQLQLALLPKDTVKITDLKSYSSQSKANLEEDSWLCSWKLFEHWTCDIDKIVVGQKQMISKNSTILKINIKRIHNMVTLWSQAESDIKVNKWFVLIIINHKWWSRKINLMISIIIFVNSKHLTYKFIYL